jgi:hypothetical protein
MARRTELLADVNIGAMMSPSALIGNVDLTLCANNIKKKKKKRNGYLLS